MAEQQTAPAPKPTPLEWHQRIVDLAAGWDEDGATGPKVPYRWETVALMAMDYARAALIDAGLWSLDDKRPAPEPLVPILTRGDRGLQAYGEPFRDAYGAELEVYESSSAESPHVWMKVVGATEPGQANHGNAPGTAFAHMNEEQARALVARLQTWLDEIPSRWDR